MLRPSSQQLLEAAQGGFGVLFIVFSLLLFFGFVFHPNDFCFYCAPEIAMCFCWAFAVSLLRKSFALLLPKVLASFFNPLETNVTLCAPSEQCVLSKCVPGKLDCALDIFWSSKKEVEGWGFRLEETVLVPFSAPLLG